jgi:hypothetical protein
MVIGLIIAGSVIALLLSMVILISNISDHKDIKRYDRGKMNVKVSNKINNRVIKDVKKVLENYSGKPNNFDSEINKFYGFSGTSGHSGVIGFSGHSGIWSWGDNENVHTTAAPTLSRPKPPPHPTRGKLFFE